MPAGTKLSVRLNTTVASDASRVEDPVEATLTEAVLAETFAGRVLRVGDLLVDVAHHHHGAG